MDSNGMLHFDSKNPGIPVTTNGIPQNLAVAAAATAFDNSHMNNFAVQKQQALQAQFNNAMSTGSAKAVQQQHQQVQVPIMHNPQFQQHMFQQAQQSQHSQQPQMFQMPQVPHPQGQGMMYGQPMPPPQGMAITEQDLINMQVRIQHQLQLPLTQQQQMKLQMQLRQLQHIHQQMQMRNHQQGQQLKPRMAAPINPQFAFRPQPGMVPQMGQVPVPQIPINSNGLRIVKSSPMVSQLANQPQNVPQMQQQPQEPQQQQQQIPTPMAAPVIPTSAPNSNPIAAAAAAAALSARQYRNPNQTGPRMGRSFSTSSHLSQPAQPPNPLPQQPLRVYSNSNTPTSMHFSPVDFSGSVLSPNSPNFLQYPSPSTTFNEVEGMDDGSSLMSPIVSPFMPNMPAIRFPTDAKRPSTDYSMDEVIAGADGEVTGSGEKPKRLRSNAQGTQIPRRLSSASDSGQLSPGSNESPPAGNFTRKPPTPTLATNNLHLSGRRPVAGRYGPGVRSPPITSPFSPPSSAAASRENLVLAPRTTPTSAPTVSPAFGSQGQQLVFPLNPGSTTKFENESIVTFDRKEGGIVTGGNGGTGGNSGNARGRARAISASNGMGRFEVLTFHQYEKPQTAEDRRLKQQQKINATPAGGPNTTKAKVTPLEPSTGTSISSGPERAPPTLTSPSSVSPVAKVESPSPVKPARGMATLSAPDGMSNGAKRVSMVREEEEEESGENNNNNNNSDSNNNSNNGHGSKESTERAAPAQTQVGSEKLNNNSPEKSGHGVNDDGINNSNFNGFPTSVGNAPLQMESLTNSNDHDHISVEGNVDGLVDGHGNSGLFILDDPTMFNDNHLNQDDSLGVEDLSKFMDYSYEMNHSGSMSSGSLMMHDATMVINDDDYLGMNF